MIVDIFTLCDNAQEYNGKLVIVGTFSSILAKQFPVTHNELAIVARIIFSEAEKRLHKITISVIKEDEEIFLLNPTDMEYDNRNITGERFYVNIVLKGNNIVIPSPGRYKVILNIDNDTKETILNVDQIAEETL